MPVVLLFESLIYSISLYRFLATSNLTTNEDIKAAYSNKRTHSNFNPFSAGNAILNCNEVLCGPLNPSLIDARGFVTDDYLISVTSPTSGASVVSHQPQGQPSGSGAIAPYEEGSNSGAVPEASVPEIIVDEQGSGAYDNPSSTSSPIKRTLKSGSKKDPKVKKSVPNSSTLPEIASNGKVVGLPPIPKSNTAQNLTLTNVGLHNRGQEQQEQGSKIDLDQTTMIGSALDLDSLESGEDDVSSSHVTLAANQAGSQVGLLKLSAV